MEVKKLAVFVSGGGSNMQAIQDAIEAGTLPARIVLVVSSSAKAFALERAAGYHIPAVVINKTTHPDPAAREKAILEKLAEAKADFCVLAGYLSIIGIGIINAYPNKIVNIHPALIPAFCGDGFYGLKVHEAALARGVKITGATVHFVNEITDGGPIIAQKAVAVEEGDTPETLQRRVMEQAEWQILPQALQLLCEGKLQVIGNKVFLKEQKND